MGKSRDPKKPDYQCNQTCPDWWFRGRQGGLVVSNRTSHLCDPGSTLASGRMWVSFSRSQPDSEGFSPGTPVFLPPQNRLPITSGWVCGYHTWIVWRQPWAPSHAFGPIPLSRLILKSPCRERSPKRTFTFTFTFINISELRWLRNVLRYLRTVLSIVTYYFLPI